MDILLYLAIAIIIIYISGLVYALIPKEKVKIAAPNVDTDKRLFKDLNTIEEKVAEALRRLDWQINDDAEEYEAGKIALPNRKAIELFVQFLKDYFIFRDDEFEAFPSVDEGIYIRVYNKYTERYLRMTICNDGVIISSPDFETTGIIYDCTVNDLAEDANDFLNERANDKQDKEIKFEHLKEGQCLWGICPYYNELSVFKKWHNSFIAVHCDDVYKPEEIKIIELIQEPKGYSNPQE